MNGTKSHGSTNGSTSSLEKNVGIVGIETYIPNTYISQGELEEYNGVSNGKYTLGLGQECMSIIHGDIEDINSICLTVVQNLLEKYKIEKSQVGRLEVGTETLVDKSKSTKTILMDLFCNDDSKEAVDIEGATVINACYGGTSALLNTLYWCESDSWDGRYGIVVCGDIACYARGPARPTSGAAAVAILISRNAPLVLQDKHTAAMNVWDFYKPDPSVEYPTVDGVLSQECYYQALESCYQGFVKKVEEKTKEAQTVESLADFFVFHAPYNKLVQKSFARLFFLDARRNLKDQENSALAPYVKLPIKETYADRQLDKVLKTASSASFTEKCTDANYASKYVGNSYTASVFLGLASLLHRRKGDLKAGSKIVLFSYGSGAVATMYSFKVSRSINDIGEKLNLTTKLDNRIHLNPSELDHALETRARMHKTGAPYQPLYDFKKLAPGTFYLQSINEKWIRSYARVSSTDSISDFITLTPTKVLEEAKRDEISSPVTGKLAVVSSRKRVACVITGISAGLPNQTPVFSEDNIDKLLNGHNCISSIPDDTIQALLDKNVVHITKSKAGVISYPVTTKEDMIQLAAQLTSLDLTSDYGVPKGLAETMDIAAQVAVAAGLEALKNAKLVSGASSNLEEWKLQPHLREMTGVVYASSFPAMDAAVGEVMRYLDSKSVEKIETIKLILELKRRYQVQNNVTKEDNDAFDQLMKSCISEGEEKTNKYQFNRKFLFKVLVLGNAQLAQLCGAMGPNTQTNAACAGTTQAISMAQDMLISGRAQRVIVIAGDNGSGSTLLPWLGAGFRALGAASTKSLVEEAALPFDQRRNGMILGAGAIGMVLETEESCISRGIGIKARLLATQYSNSAYHGAAMDSQHIGKELNRFLVDVETLHGIPKSDIANKGVYLSHETCTHASPTTSCSYNETMALRQVFGSELLKKLLICNTKGFTGHPMGVSFEDVVAVGILMRQKVPPIPNWKDQDEYLGTDLNLSLTGGEYKCRYALRFSAGFGSQVAFALYEMAES